MNTKKKNRSRRWRIRDDAGQGTVELALVLPVIMLLMVGIIEFARAWNMQQVLTDAVREGARRASLADDKTWDDTRRVMWERVDQAGYHPGYSNLMTQPKPPKFKETGELVTISMTLPYRFWVLPFREIQMKSSFTVRNE